jgi:hypothetical protein
MHRAFSRKGQPGMAQPGMAPTGRASSYREADPYTGTCRYMGLAPARTIEFTVTRTPPESLAFRLLRLAGVALLAFAVAWALTAATARANGTPIRLQLTYLNGVSNFGSQNAIATGEMITSEAELRLTTAGLQRLADNEEYHVWISAGTTDRMRLTGFSVNDAGVANVDVVVPGGIPEKNWDLIVLTVEAKGSQPANPSERRAIAGRFSMANPTGTGPQPKVLPNTGGAQTITAAAPSFGMSSGGLILLVLLAVGGIGFALGRAGNRTGA